MTATTADPFQRAFVQSTVGHVVIFGCALLAMFLSQFFTPVQPVEAPIEVAIIAGPKAAGEFGTPSPDAKTEENVPPQNIAPPPAPPEQPKIEEPIIKEPPPVKIVEPPKPPEVIKQPEPQKPPEVVKQPEPPKQPEKPKHQVEVHTNTVLIVLPKPQQKIQTASSDSKKPTKSPTSEQIAKLLGKDLPISKNGGAGFDHNAAPGSIARGTPSGAMDLYHAKLKANLYNAWIRPAGIEGLMTSVHISIARDGHFISARITRRSGNEQMDNTVMQAIRSITPMPLPPEANAPFEDDLNFEASGASV